MAPVALLWMKAQPDGCDEPRRSIQRKRAVRMQHADLDESLPDGCNEPRHADHHIRAMQRVVQHLSVRA